jgi:hypothetical protein
MLDFIWRLRGSVALDRTGPNEVALERVERLLEGQRKGVSERGADYLAFDDPFCPIRAELARNGHLRSWSVLD